MNIFRNVDYICAVTLDIINAYTNTYNKPVPINKVTTVPILLKYNKLFNTYSL